jgi:transposase InsO family protein
VAAVVDLFSRRVVGWSMSTAMTAQLVTDALVMAIWRRGKPDAAASLRPWQPIHQREVPAVDGRSRRGLLDDLMEALRRSVGGAAAETPKKQSKKQRKAAVGQKEMLMPIAGKKPAKDTT